MVYFNRKLAKWEFLYADLKFDEIGRGAGCIYLVSKNKLFACHLTSKQLTEVIVVHPKSSVIPLKVFYKDNNNNVWAADKLGNIFCRWAAAKQFTWLGNINSNEAAAAQYPVYSLCVDEQQGILWVGSDVLGLLKASIRPKLFQTFPQQQPGKQQNSVFIHSIFEDDDGKAWLGTFRNGCIILDPKTGETQKKKLASTKDVDQESESVIYSDSKGNLWIGNYAQFFVRKAGQQNFIPVHLMKPAFPITGDVKPLAIYEWKDTVYLSTSWGIYGAYQQGGKFKVHHYTESGGGYYYDIFVPDNKSFWLATENGIFCKSSLHDEKPDSILFKDFGIKSFHRDDLHDLIWISTTNGLIAYHLPSGNFRLFTEANGLGNNYVYGILQ